MHFEKTFEVAGSPERVMDLFQDLPTMAGFLPGASLGERAPDGSYPATMLVAFGPKRIAFKGRLTHEPDLADLSGRVEGQAGADMRGAKMSVTMTYRLVPASSGTQVVLVSDAELTGMLAEFARTGGVAIADALIADFASRFSAAVAAEGSAPAGPLSAPGPAPALSASALFLQASRAVLRSLWSRFFRGDGGPG